MKLNLTYSGLKESEFDTKEFNKKIKEIHEKLHSEDTSAGTTW